MNHDAVILLAYGGPEHLEDVPDYLKGIRAGKETSSSLIQIITRRYQLIGGSSPITSITRSTAGKLAAATGLPVFVGMRHWHPTIADTVKEIVDLGVQHLVAICMTPHYSRMSVEAYRDLLNAALEAVDLSLQVDFVENWHIQPDYLSGVGQNVRQAIDRFPKDLQGQVKVLFTAHGLPARVLDEGDPYESQLRQTARLVAEKQHLPETHWQLCYQSAGHGREAWLGPSLEETMDRLATAGDRNLVVAPIGFVADNLEILYDLDIEAQDTARQLGIRLERTSMLNDSPVMIDVLVDLVGRYVDLKGRGVRTNT